MDIETSSARKKQRPNPPAVVHHNEFTGGPSRNCYPVGRLINVPLTDCQLHQRRN